MFTYVVSKTVIPTNVEKRVDLKEVFVRTVKAYNIEEALDQVIDPYYMDDIYATIPDADYTNSGIIYYFDKTEDYRRYVMDVIEIHESKFYDVLKNV